MNTSKTLLIATLTGKTVRTVAELAVVTSLSESRVREILKTIDNVQTVAGKPAKFWIEPIKATKPTPAVKVAPKTEGNEDACPLCGGHSSSQWPGAGPAGTFLGDSCNECHECGKVYNRYTGEEVMEGKAVSAAKVAPKTEGDEGACPLCGGHSSSQTRAGPEDTFLGDSCNECHECGKVYNIHSGEEVMEGKAKSRKSPLNPQPKIDAKTAVVEAGGGTLVYASRKWTVAKGKKSRTMSSQEFSAFTGKELLGLVK